MEMKIGTYSSSFCYLLFFLCCRISMPLQAEEIIKEIPSQNKKERKEREIKLLHTKVGFRIKIIKYVYYEVKRGEIAPRGVGERVFEIPLKKADVKDFVAFLESTDPNQIHQLDVWSDEGVGFPLGKIMCRKDADGNVMFIETFELTRSKMRLTGMLTSEESILLSKNLRAQIKPNE
jgi:hypothetical protein